MFVTRERLLKVGHHVSQSSQRNLVRVLSQINIVKEIVDVVDTNGFQFHRKCHFSIQSKRANCRKWHPLGLQVLASVAWPFQCPSSQ